MNGIGGDFLPRRVLGLMMLIIPQTNKQFVLDPAWQLIAEEGGTQVIFFHPHSVNPAKRSLRGHGNLIVPDGHTSWKDRYQLADYQPFCRDTDLDFRCSVPRKGWIASACGVDCNVCSIASAVAGTEAC
jgi:hypothetical protein